MVWILNQQPSKSAKAVAQYIKTLFRWASSEDVALVSRNPVATFRLPKQEQKPEPIVIPKPMQDDVMASLRLTSIHEAKWHLVANFQLQLGLRTAEVFGLQWQDVDWDSRRCRIHQNMTLTHGLQSRTKTGKERWVPLNEIAYEILRTMQKAHKEPFVFPWPRQTYQTSFRSAMQRLVRKGVIKHRYRPYDLRHTFISSLLEQGIPVTQVARWAGNSPKTCWEHYAGTTNSYEMPLV
jgi:integrase